MTVQLMTSELVRILKDAALFVRTSPDIPIINAVHLSTRGQELIAVGTDRFVLGASKAELDADSSGEFAAALPLRQVKTILQLAGACKQSWSRVAIDSGEDGVRVAFSSGETLVLPAGLETGAHIAWLKLLHSAPEDAPSKAMDLNPQLLARFGRVSGGSSRARWFFFGHTRPVRVTIGDDFVGIVMPIRLPDDATGGGWVVPEWTKPVEPAKPVRKSRAKQSAGKNSAA